jgi:hypothetical protein
VPQAAERRSRSEVDAAVGAAERGIEAATLVLTRARDAYVKADAAWLDDGSKRAREARAERSDELDRAERLAKRAQERLDGARAELAEIQREEKLAELAELRAKLASFGETVAAHAAEFVAADRAVDARVMACAVDVRDAIALHDRASAIVRELRVQEPLAKRPDLANVSLDVRRVVTEARQRDGRDALAVAWLSDSPDARDWRLRDQGAGDLLALEVANRRDAAIAEAQRQAAVFAAGIEAGKSAAPPKQEPKPEPPKAEGATT